jgi:hypothetical protein
MASFATVVFAGCLTSQEDIRASLPFVALGPLLAAILRAGCYSQSFFSISSSIL